MSSFLYANDFITIILSSVDGTYIVEFLNDYPTSIILKESTNDNNDKRVVIDCLDESFINYLVSLDIISKASAIIEQDDILISINNDIMINKSLEKVSEKISTLNDQFLSRSFIFIKQEYYNDYIMKNNNNKKKVLTDFYGFSRDDEYMIREYMIRDQIQNIISARDLEWISYLKSIGGPDNLKPGFVFKSCAQLKALCRRGIPVAFRSLIWQKVSLSSMIRSQYPTDYYKNLVENRSQLNQKVSISIEKDIHRTFPEHSYFDSDNGIGISSLRNVLQCFAMHNTEIGYCQSLNFLSGMMLLFMNEEDSFWLLVTIVEKLLPKDYYTKSMIGIHVDQFVLAEMVKLHLPKIHQKLDEFQLQLQLISVPWFLCLFVNTLRPEVCLRVWDMFLNEGSKVLFRIGIALLKANQNNILNAKDSSELFLILRNIGTNIVDADSLIALAYKSHINPTSKSNSKTKLKERPPPPIPLIGLGLAHYGPLLSPLLTSSPVELVNSSPDNENVTYDKSLYYSFKSPEPYPSNVEINTQTKTEQSKVIKRRSSFLTPRHDYRNFKRQDIDNCRNKFLPVCLQQQQQMEAARRSTQVNEEQQPNEE